MVKYFCDRCGAGIDDPDDKYRITWTQLYEGLPAQKAHRDLCPECHYGFIQYITPIE